MTGPGASGRTSDLVHALAQLPDSVALELDCSPAERSSLALLARAYAVEDRLTLRDRAGDGAAWRFAGVPESAPAWAVDPSVEQTLPETLAETVESIWPEGERSSSSKRDASLLRGHRIAVVTNLPTHYRVPLFTRLDRRLAAAGASLRVFFLGADAPGRPWLSAPEGLGFDHEFLAGTRVPVRRRRPPTLPLNLRRRLRAFDPTIVLAPGFSPLASAEVAAYARRRRIPFGIWSGEIPTTAARRAQGRLRALERRWLARRADFAISYGSLAERYLESLAPGLPVVIGRNTSVAGTTGARDGARDPIEIVAVADLALPGKGLEVVLEALGLIGDARCRLSVIGGSLPDGASSNGAADERVRFLGPLPQDEVRAAYESSDVFVFPSRIDVFGLALVEAMASELAVIATPLAGAAADLAVPGRNCLLADARAPASWAERIRALVEDEGSRRSLASAARETIARRWTFDHAAEAMVAGFRLGALVAERSRP